MAPASQILNKIDFTLVTPEQIGKCHKCFDGSIPFYMVESEEEKFDQNGERIEYKVTYDKEHGFRCSCKSGQEGFFNCKNGVCKHVIWSIAASREEHQAMARIAQEQAAEVLEEKPVLLIDGKPAHPLTLETVLTAKPKKSHGNAKANNPKPFSILR